MRRNVITLSRRVFHDARTTDNRTPDKRWPDLQVVIGVETHAQIKSRRKLFSHSCTSQYSSHIPPNTNVSAFDAAFPGTLPRLNPVCVDLALRTALALGCDIQPHSSFDRKHYFYSDLPSGYQITQQYAPLAKNGTLCLPTANNVQIPIRIKQIQLEQDTAKSTFVPRIRTSQIDLNRAGTGLMEIVSEPDLRSPEEAAAYVRTLQSLLRAIGSSDGNMEDGSLRCDVNVSINRRDAPPGSGTRCEIKNLNSVRFITAAIIYEIKRQSAILTSPNLSDKGIEQETRGFDELTFQTFRLRSKEDAPDYRYMPDPNLGILRISQNRIDSIKTCLPELPWVTRNRLKEDYGLSERDVEVLLNIDNGRDVKYDGEDPGESGAVRYFDRLVEGNGNSRDPKVVANWMTHELLGQLSALKKTFQENTITIVQLGELIDMVQSRIITGTTGKHLIRRMLKNQDLMGTSPLQLAKELDLLAFSPSSSTSPPSSVSGVSSSSLLLLSSSSTLSSSHPSSTKSTPNTGTGTGTITESGSRPPLNKPNSETETATDPLVVALCQNAIKNLPSVVEAATKNGQRNVNVLNKIVGVVMKESRGRADAKIVKEVVERLVFGDV